MDKEIDPYALNCVEVKGMSRFSIPYIKRFFSHAGQIENVRKLEDKVIIRFKHHSSVNKAHRFNGRMIDKQLLKIRNLTPYVLLEEVPPKKRVLEKPVEKSEKEKNYDKIKYGPLDIPFHLAQVIKITDKLEDSWARWLIYQLFSLKLYQIFHLFFFKENSQSLYFEKTLQELFLEQKSNKTRFVTEENNIQKIEIYSQVPNDLQFEANYESYANNIECRIRNKFISLKKYNEGHKLLKLYILFYANSLISEPASIIYSVEEEEPKDKEEYKKIIVEFKNQNKVRISVQEWSAKKERSEYRDVDKDHPSKQIEIFSDSCFHQNVSKIAIYDFFRDSYDGCLSNNCAADIFHDFHPNFQPNYLIIKHNQFRQIFHIRLEFELRILNSGDETLLSTDYTHYLSYQKSEGVSRFLQLEEIKLLQHNLVLSEYSNIEKVLYLIKNYVYYYCLNRSDASESDSAMDRPMLAIFIILTNATPEAIQSVKKVYDELSSNERIKQVKTDMYIIAVRDIEKFEKSKLKNFIEDYVDKLECELTSQIARFHSRQLMESYPEKFKGIPGIEQFTAITLWNLYLDKSKRKNKNRLFGYLNAP